MSSPDSQNSRFTTPNTSPETTDADLNALQNTLNTIRARLNESLVYFDEHFSSFSGTGSTISQQLTERPHQVSPTNTSPSDNDVLQQLGRVRELIDQGVSLANTP